MPKSRLQLPVGSPEELQGDFQKIVEKYEQIEPGAFKMAMFAVLVAVINLIRVGVKFDKFKNLRP